MKVAVPSAADTGMQSPVYPHFGRCPYFTLIEVEAGEVKEVSTIKNPYFGNHAPGEVPGFINEQGVNVMLAGGMGRRAVEFFEQFGIEAVTGAGNTVGESIQAYLNGQIAGSAPCTESVAHNHHDEEPHH